MLWLLLIVISAAQLLNGEPIVRGVDVTKMKHTFLVFLRIIVPEKQPSGVIKKFLTQGGGSLIHKNIVLTAAHNVVFLSVPTIQVFGGQVRPPQQHHELYKQEKASIWKMESYMVHAFYETKENVDIALLYLKPKKMNPLFPVNIGTLGPPVTPKDMVEVTGWGYMENAVEATILQEGKMQITETNFDDGHKYIMILDDPHGNVAGCKGDSGGPIIINNEIVGVFITTKMDEKLINGVNKRVCRPGGPSVAIVVDKVREWININVPHKNELATLAHLQRNEFAYDLLLNHKIKRPIVQSKLR